MLGRLVSVSIVTHVRNLHLCDFMNTEIVIAVVIDRWNHKDRIKHLGESLLSTHFIYEAVNVVEYGPCIMPCISFCVCITPFVRTERLLELAVLVASAHKIGRMVEYILPVLRSFLPFLDLLCRASELLCHLKDAPVVVCILESSCHVLVHIHIVWNITEGIVPLMAETAA